MKVKDQVNKIVAELCQIEPSFVGRESELSELVEKLLVNKPDVKIDSGFVSNLKKSLLSDAESTTGSHPIKKINFNFMNKFQFAGLSALAVVIIALVVYTGSTSPTVVKIADFGTPVVQNLGKTAFGSLAVPEGGWSAPNALSASGRATGMGGGGNGKAEVAMDTSMIAPPYEGITLFRYIYSGEQQSLEQDEMPVYKRVAKNLSSAVNGVIKNIGLGLVDTTVFKNAQIRSISFVDKAGEDWGVYVDFDQGLLNLYREIPYAAEPTPYEPMRLDQIPPDNQLIAMAQQAIDRFGIDLQAYGEPRVMDEWRIYYERSADKSSYYFPEYANVVFPQLIDGVEAVEQNGYSDGIMVGIDIRNNRVTSVNNIYVQSFESSNYGIQKDVNQLVKNYSDRTQAWGYPTDTPITYIDVQLGEPEMTVAKVYRWQNNMTEQLYVPALSFPVLTELPDYPYMQEHVVIPLVEEVVSYY